MTVTERFGMRIKELRMQQGISQEELGFRCHLSKNYISSFICILKHYCLCMAFLIDHVYCL